MQRSMQKRLMEARSALALAWIARVAARLCSKWRCTSLALLVSLEKERSVVLGAAAA